MGVFAPSVRAAPHLTITTAPRIIALAPLHCSVLGWVRHAFRRYPSLYGHKVVSPNLLRALLADSGTTFLSHAHAHATPSVPSPNIIHTTAPPCSQIPSQSRIKRVDPNLLNPTIHTYILRYEARIIMHQPSAISVDFFFVCV